jgi:hypothetical protein
MGEVLEQTQRTRVSRAAEWCARVVLLSNETRQRAVRSSIRCGPSGVVAAPFASSLERPRAGRTPCCSQSRVWALLLATKFSARSYAGPPLYHESPGGRVSAGVADCMDAGVVVGPAVESLHCAPASPTNPARPSGVPAHRFLFRVSSLADRLAYLSRRVLHSQCRPCLQGLSTSFFYVSRFWPSLYTPFVHRRRSFLCISPARPRTTHDIFLDPVASPISRQFRYYDLLSSHSFDHFIPTQLPRTKSP